MCVCCVLLPPQATRRPKSVVTNALGFLHTFASTQFTRTYTFHAMLTRSCSNIGMCSHTRTIILFIRIECQNECKAFLASEATCARSSQNIEVSQNWNICRTILRNFNILCGSCACRFACQKCFAFVLALYAYEKYNRKIVPFLRLCRLASLANKGSMYSKTILLFVYLNN